MLKNIARACLRVVMLTLPVVIAACYGMPAKFSKNGKVIDKQTQAGIADIRVSCVEANGTVSASASSYGTDGAFILYYDTACDHLDATDTVTNYAGAARYQETTVPFGSGDITIQMDKQP